MWNKRTILTFFAPFMVYFINHIAAETVYECSEASNYRTVYPGPVCTFKNVTFSTINGSHETFQTRNNQYIKIIVFENSTIHEVPRLMFQKMPNVENLTMKNVGLRDELNKYSFEYGNSLIFLHLTDNHLTVVDKFAFNGARKLQIIDLSRNAINVLDVNAFAQCTKLKRLYLTSNSLKYLPSDVFQSLEGVFLIDLSFNQLEELDKNLFRNCKNLRDVNLMGNELKVLDLKLPFSLLKLDVSNNHLERFTIENAHNRNVSDAREQLRLIAVNNSISEFYVNPDFVVTHIDLSQNSMKSIENISRISSLVDLSLDFNPIGHLPLNAFDNMTELISLDLKHTNLEKIEFGTFSQGAKLKNLDISYNNFSEIDLDMLAALSALEELSISGNNLSKIEYTGLLELFPRLRLIGISDNNWNCKTLANILKYLNKQHIRLLPHKNTQNHVGPNLKGVSCHFDPKNIPVLTKNQKIRADDEENFNELSETKQRLNKMTDGGALIKKIREENDIQVAKIKEEVRAVASVAAKQVQDNGVVSSSADIKAIKIMVFVLLLINVVFFGIKLGRYIKTKKSSRSIRLSGGTKDENFMDDLVSS
uniref:CSON005332 protein n=1 Tax=Culicoides sonorensis TaxID=179676 RepID=A0A336L777_CULSO